MNILDIVEANRLRKLHGLLTPEELSLIRIRLNIDTQTADGLFGLADGSYEKYEKGLKLQSSTEDFLIRMTNGLDNDGKTILPKSIQRSN